jgi:adenylate cyclase
MTLINVKDFSWKRFAGVFIALGTVILVEILFNTSFIPDTLGTTVFQAVERRSFDLLMRFRGVRANAGDVVMININEDTDKELGWPLPRDQYGVVMAILSNYGAKAVALDVPLPARKDVDSTENIRLVQYLSVAHNTFQVIGPYIPSRTEGDQISRKGIDSAAHFVIGKFGIPAPGHHHFPRSPFMNDYPFDKLAEVTTGLGHIILIPDTLDGIIRSVPLYIEYAGKLYPSLGFALALHTLNIQPSQVKFVDTENGTEVYAGPLLIRTGLLGEVVINYIGKGENFPSVSFYDILVAYKEQDEKFLSRFKGKVCIIGPTFRASGDYYATPLEDMSAGFFTHANVYDMAVTDSFIVAAPSWLQFIILLIITLAVGYVAHAKQMRIGILILIAVTLCYLALAAIAFSSAHIWFNVAEPLSGLFICFVSTVAYRAATEGRQRKMITNIFRLYVDSTVVQILINNPHLVKLGGEKREISVLFTDIEGFSGISEKVSEEVLVRMMNIYLTDMTDVILKTRGTVDKFIGDAIMAFWGAPLADDDSAYHACIAALEMQSRLHRLQPKFGKMGGVGIRQRIGLNTGICLVGNIGSEQKLNYTAMGDPVNLASRLEGVNKQYGTGILISESTYQKVMKRVYVREVDRVQVVGKMEPVHIYELLDTAAQQLSEKMKYFLDIYGQGLKAYQERRWDEGIAYMEHAMLQIPDDPVSQLYIERMKLFKINPPSEDWNGVFVLHAK